MHRSLQTLGQWITRANAAHLTEVDSVLQHAHFPKLQSAAKQVERIFSKPRKAVEPPQEKRAQALKKFLQTLELSPVEWRYVFAGLSDPLDAKGQCLLHDDNSFSRVITMR